MSRFFLGFSEAAYYPGVLFMLSKWYKQDELGLRMACFTCGSTVSNVFGSLIASGILATMDEVLGYAAWRWLFFIEGGLTCLLAVIALYVVPNFPGTPAAWLTSEEHALAQTRMEEDVRGVDSDLLKRMEGSGLVAALTDWTVWWLACALGILNAALSYGVYFPTLAATMGYSPTITLLLCAPPWLVSLVTSLMIMRHSDVTRDRFWHIVGPVTSGIIGFVIAISTMNTAVRYLSLFFMAQATVSYILLLTWVSNSIPESPSKRAVALAFVNACASFGNIGASYMWPSTWGPSYSKSYLICIATALTSLIMLWVYRVHLIRLNMKAEINERVLGLREGFRYIT
ncbi:hypothetical protein ID866_2440 [Astraeus odoratus]|nr:hypothetical protein ID866_2440 [Astraeus odoratus]